MKIKKETKVSIKSNKNVLSKGGESIVGEKERGKRDGTGPYKHSYQKQKSDKGKREESGKPCPKKKETSK